MGPHSVGRTKRNHCPMCSKPYREDNMVECTQCKKWYCYECVNATDEMAQNDAWLCPLCEIDIANKRESVLAKPTTASGYSQKSKHTGSRKSTKSKNTKTVSQSKSNKNSGAVSSSKAKLKLQLLQEERELLRQERELTRKARLLLEEDDSDSSQHLSDCEIDETNTIANHLLSLQVEKNADQDNKYPKEKYDSKIENSKTKSMCSNEEIGYQPINKPFCNDFKTYDVTPQQWTARRSVPNELPVFSGNPFDWPLFIGSFERSSQLCGFDNSENLLRLQKSLKGAAKSAVSSFLILPECVPQIIATLRMLFGRPEQILEAHINLIRHQQPPKAEKLETLVQYALAVKNLCVSLEAANMGEYLNNPTLMHELLEKLPSQIKVNWAMYRSTLSQNNSLTDFAEWIYNMATNVCTALPSLVVADRSNPTRHNERSNTHSSNSLENNLCKICNGNCKNAGECQKFSKLPIEDKWKIVKNLNLCRLCLKRHRFPFKYPVKCNKNQCTRKHHPKLHKDEETFSQNQIASTSESHYVSITSETISSNSENIPFRILPVKIKNGEKEVETYAFLDEGSSVTLINESLAKYLDLEGSPEPLCLKWTSNQQRFENNSQRVFFSISGNFEAAKEFESRTARTVHALKLPQQTVNVAKLKNEYPYLRNLPIKSYTNVTPQVLIGLDNWKLALPLRVREGNSGEPIAAKCRLGWSVFAVVPAQPSTNEFTYHVCDCIPERYSNQELFEEVKKYFSVESLGVQTINKTVSKELERANFIQESTLIQDCNHYKIGLLWRYDSVKLPNSREMAFHRLNCIEKRIKVKPELKIKINQQIEDFKEKKYIRKLTEDELSQNYERIWYLPIFPVFNPNKPGKFRLVWDAAASVQGISLNSMLLKGDDQLSSLLGVLLRFRERKIGFTADIKEMFLRVGVIEEDQHAQRFFWRNGNPEDPLETYVMTVMTFGASCSPSNAQYVKYFNAQKFATQYPRAVESILKNHYVDDLLDTADTEEEAITIAEQVKLIHSRANFDIRNWRSNSSKFNEKLNSVKQDLVEVNLNIGNKENVEKVLGMWWNLEKDCFVFSLRFNKGNHEVLNGTRKPTKRDILQILMSIYDPLGLISNFLVYLKIILQEIWKSNISWDQSINEEQNKKWLLWLKDLKNIENIEIPRCYLNKILNWSDVTIQLHIFVDASEQATAVVGYLRIQKPGRIECVLIGAKTHVAPIKPQTIPRLELDGAVMGARFSKNIIKYLSVTVSETFYWCDSIIVLSWLRTNEPRRLSKFVTYRVAEIQDNSMISNWRYVPTKLNVADEATKWTKEPNLRATSNWFRGPDFLYKDENDWPMDSSLRMQENTTEIATVHEVNETIINIYNFSTFCRLLRTMAYVFRFINLLKARINKYETLKVNLTSDVLQSARNALIKMIQKEYYQDEIKHLQKNNCNSSLLQPAVKQSSILYKLSPYLNSDGILRVRGRLDAATYLEMDAKRPIILPRDSHLTLLIVEQYHRRFQHQNHETVVNEIRQKFHISKLRRVLNKVRRNCQTCKVKFATPQSPEMSTLPACRLAAFTAPFTYTGVDYVGPINVTVGRRVEKRWGALFTCLTTRAVHLEIAHKLDADNCILCFTNFMNRRGRLRHIYCDRGTNFIATERILREELKKVDPEKITRYFVSPELKFHFNSPLSPHMAGAWERLVKAVKISLYNALPTRTPTEPLLQSCLITAENIVNSRPLTYLPLDSEESEALTPNHFLLGSSNGEKSLGQLDDNAKILKYNYLYKEQFANKCWQRFVKEYIHKLLLRKKWYKQIDPIKIGNIVVICDKDLPRSNWPKGKVIAVKEAPDGQVRKATVQTLQGVFERPVVKLAVLSVKQGTASQESAVPGGSVKNE